MRPAIGFLVFHVVVVATGLAPLRSLWGSPQSREGLAWMLAPGFLLGLAVIVPLMVVLTVVGVPLTLFVAAPVCLACALSATYVSRRAAGVKDGTDDAPPSGALARGLGLSAAVYAVVGGWAFSRMPTVLDDARIWSLRGLTLFYYHGLQPEIFQNAGQSGGHGVYPLFQPTLEALLFHAMGGPQLRFWHTELWLIFLAAVWTAGMLIKRARPRGTRASRYGSIAVLAGVALTPAAIHNVAMGYADTTGAILLAVGTLAIAIWLETRDRGTLALAIVLLAAAASTKDEDLIASIIVLLAGSATVLLDHRSRSIARPRPGDARAWLLAGAYFVAIVAPWRIWVAAHHLTDSVEPPIPRALSPSFLFGRTHQFHQAIAAMGRQTLHLWGALGVVFLLVCAVSISARIARRATAFYLAAMGITVLALLWLYTTTAVSLAFLIPTSMDRTVAIFMAPAALAAAYLIAQLGEPAETHRVGP